jgi:hypothetical protein
MDFFEAIKAAFGAFVGGAAVYAAIKSELADHKARIVIAEKAIDKAHERIDSIQNSRIHAG